MKFWNKNNNSLFCRCIFHEPQKAKWKGTIVHFSFNAQRSFETIMYYNITYSAKIGMYRHRVYFPLALEVPSELLPSRKTFKKMILALWWKQCCLPYIELFSSDFSPVYNFLNTTWYLQLPYKTTTRRFLCKYPVTYLGHCNWRGKTNP